MKLSVVIPAYNEAENIGPTVRELSTVLDGIEGVTLAEVIVVDDHSDDDTFGQALAVSDHPVKPVRLSRRSGSHTALRAGLARCTGDAALCISADGQDDPAVLADMVYRWKAGRHIVWAVRKGRKEGFMYKLLTWIFYFMLKRMTDQGPGQVNLANADFYLLDRKVVDAVCACEERNTSLFGLILWMGFDQDHVEYERRERRAGESKWSFRTRMRLARDWMIAFSAVPLKLMLIVGLSIATIGFLYAVFIIVYALMGFTPPGWAETVILILIIGGVQMTMLGIIGEYMWRNLDETRKRPLYFIERDEVQIQKDEQINEQI